MKKLLAVSLAVFMTLMFLALPAEANQADYLVGDFYDLVNSNGQKHWAYEQMSELIAMGILKGTTQKVYDKNLGRTVTVQMALPAKNITRAEFAAILFEALNYTPVIEKAPFKDSIPAWAAQAVNTLYKNGIIKGNPDGKFWPGRSITRAEMATMLVLAARTDISAANPRFPDVPQTHWAYQAIQKASALGIINGLPDGRFAPNRSAQRAEVMAMLYNYLLKSKNDLPEDSALLARADQVGDGMESIFNGDEGADIDGVLPYLTGEIETYMASAESRTVIDNLKEEGLLGYRITSPGRVVGKSSYWAEVAYDTVVTFKTDAVSEEVEKPLHYSLMKIQNQWFVYKENFE